MKTRLAILLAATMLALGCGTPPAHAFTKKVTSVRSSLAGIPGTFTVRTVWLVGYPNVSARYVTVTNNTGTWIEVYGQLRFSRGAKWPSSRWWYDTRYRTPVPPGRTVALGSPVSPYFNVSRAGYAYSLTYVRSYAAPGTYTTVVDYENGGVRDWAARYRLYTRTS